MRESPRSVRNPSVSYHINRPHGCVNHPSGRCVLSFLILTKRAIHRGSPIFATQAALQPICPFPCLERLHRPHYPTGSPHSRISNILLGKQRRTRALTSSLLLEFVGHQHNPEQTTRERTLSGARIQWTAPPVPLRAMVSPMHLELPCIPLNGYIIYSLQTKNPLPLIITHQRRSQPMKLAVHRLVTARLSPSRNGEASWLLHPMH